ncbi:MAG TPA: endonuclease domain-containing protein [Allosphingosinicella sp.]|nr:endonuclease domain-containing protein [Allosphingosinicella sp.]
MGRDWRLVERARQMRREPTEPEKRLWRNLSNRQLGGHKFRRQTTIEPFIVDFLCPAKALIVEVDGETHVAEVDARRDALLAGRGYTTIRFTNEDVMANMDGVLTVILQTLENLPGRWQGAPDSPTPNPSPEGEGLPS